MDNILATFKKRGFLENTTNEEELNNILEKEKISCYIGFDPTASSLHIGSLVPIMSLAHMQRAGHKPIALVGGGTGLIGDPSGKTEMRKLISTEEIEINKKGIKKQLSRYIDFNDKKAELLDNADWLIGIKYIEFLRDIGKHFNVNTMLKAESCKLRLDSEDGLSFIEFNYTLLQSYDFLELFKSHNCILQMGGSDQWGNIVSGCSLIRKVLRKTAYGLTFPLITTSSGAKMGKTAKGAIWLDKERTSPYDFYQYWVNTDDKDVARFLSLFTFLPLEEIEEIKKLEGQDLNNAKKILAFEATKLAHGKQEAEKAFETSMKMFGDFKMPQNLMPSSSIKRDAIKAKNIDMPSTEIEFKEDIKAIDLFALSGLVKSKGEAKRLVNQNGAYINDKRVDNIDYIVKEDDFKDGMLLLRSGKKKYHKIIKK